MSNMFSAIILSAIMLSIIFVECRYAQCCWNEWQLAKSLCVECIDIERQK
jgi:hypothetical protein